MTHSMLAVHRARYAASLAATLGCEVSAFESNALTVVERPTGSREPFVALVATFGTGTVISVVPEFIGVVRALEIEPHFRAFYPPAVIDPLIAEAARRGRELAYRPANLLFLPDSPPPDVPLPGGFRLDRVDAAWRERHVGHSRFSNALGDPGNAYVAGLWRSALVVFDPSGEPAAVAGTYDDGEGILEIGVDVAREHRGRGLARLVVAAQARAILDGGLTPTYYCAPANIRSQRTALTCGFLPVASLARVVERRG